MAYFNAIALHTDRNEPPHHLNDDGAFASLLRQFILQYLVDLSWVGFTLGCLHHFTDKEAEKFISTAFVFRELFGELIDDTAHHGSNRTDIGDLL
jgi:hypothetical protein